MSKETNSEDNTQRYPVFSVAFVRAIQIWINVIVLIHVW